MVTIKSMQTKPQKPYINPPTDVDMDIIEYFYGATFNDVTCDKKLMDLVLHNGFYKEAFCDAFQIEKIVLEHRGVEYKLQGTSHREHSSLETLQGHGPLIIGVNKLNEKLENINKITPLVER
jgi:hypothetical protein